LFCGGKFGVSGGGGSFGSAMPVPCKVPWPQRP
jgi:hypothetical protein